MVHWINSFAFPGWEIVSAKVSKSIPAVASKKPQGLKQKYRAMIQVTGCATVSG